MNYLTIKEQKTFKTIYKRGKSFNSDILTLLLINCEVTQSAFVVSRKIGNAVCRNLVKRRLRVLFNEIAKCVPNASYLWIAKPAIASANFQTIQDEMWRLSELAKKTQNKGKIC